MSVCLGSGPGLFLWPCSPLHLGNRHPGSWTEFHHDRHLLRAVCYGGKNAYWLYTWDWVNKHEDKCVCSCFTFHVCKGFLEPSVVPFCSGAADPLHRHHAYSAGRHFSGCSASDGDERLPQRASKHAGQPFNKVLTFLWEQKRLTSPLQICNPSFVWCVDYNPVKYSVWLFFLFDSSHLLWYQFWPSPVWNP